MQPSKSRLQDVDQSESPGEKKQFPFMQVYRRGTKACMKVGTALSFSLGTWLSVSIACSVVSAAVIAILLALLEP
jgi:hypothetical protein